MRASPLIVTWWDLHSLLWPNTTMHLDGNQFRFAILNKIECHECNIHAQMRLPLPTRSIARSHSPDMETNERHSTTKMPMKICYTNSKPNSWKTCHEGVGSSVFVHQSF